MTMTLPSTRPMSCSCSRSGAHSYHAPDDHGQEGAMAGLLESKAGIVTGAAGGIGGGIAIELAREGAYVLVSDLEPEAERAQETIALCLQAGGAAAWRACDVTSAEAQDALVGDVLRTHGRLGFRGNKPGGPVPKA